MTENGKKSFRLRHWHLITAFLVVYDAVAVNLSYFLALWIRFECRLSSVPQKYLDAYISFIPVYTIVSIVVFAFCKLYKSIWRFASYTELMRIVAAVCITGAVHTAGITFLYCRMPVTYYCFGIVLQFLAILGVRFSYRLFLLIKGSRHKKQYLSNVMLIGAGNAGQMVLRDALKSKDYNDKICCIIDDNPNKWNRSIEGVPIVGGREDILYNVKKYNIQKIYIVIPSATADQKREILNVCHETGCELKHIPGLYQLANGEASLSAMKDVSVEDLLGRDPITVDLKEVAAFIKGKTVLVTGGGGSIGSELCRQVASYEPKQLIIFDVYENNAYGIQLELRDKYPELNLVVLIGSVRDSRKMNAVFAKYKPNIVYHAAAHKHVPLMEDSPCEAIKNNTIGTYKTAYAAAMNGCERFVLISTDKAVNPTNIMGASKRLCEMVIQLMNQKVKEGRFGDLDKLSIHSDGKSEESDRSAAASACTEFVAVRFGNVLGSNGSVIPVFKKQIEKGGPVKVTHPDIIRYFMTISEAVSLVMLAGTYASGGEIFVLDMGSPVKIDTLARNLIRESGYIPDKDIKIEYTGLRPGEKLYEEKLMAEEGLQTTPNKLIHIAKPIPFDTDKFISGLGELAETVREEREDIKDVVARVVSTYRPDGVLPHSS